MTTMNELKSTPHWVGHKKKIPKNPHNGANAQTNNPATWATAANAWSAKKRYKWDGIGYVFTIGVGIVGIDLDDCFNGDGRGVRDLKKDWAHDIVCCLNSYTEYSPSGNGLHIYVEGTIPYSINKSKDGVEIYNELRYFTVTGNRMPGTPDEILTRDKEILDIHCVFDEPAPAAVVSASTQTADNQSASVRELQQALSYIPKQSDYLDWIKVLMAVHDVMPGTDGISLIESWSPGYSGEVENKFKSFDRTAKSEVTIKTLWKMATDNGYRSNRNSTNSPHRKKPLRNYQQKSEYLASL